jgi:hypothetical protein
MHIVMKAAAKRRKGVSLVESLVLIIVVAFTLGAIFSTMWWASTTYIFGRQDSESRQVLFAWHQTFEALWPPEDFPIPAPGEPMLTPGFIQDEARRQIRAAGIILGDNNATDRRAQVGGYTVDAVPTAPPGTGMVEITITVSAGDRAVVRNLVRRFNIFNSETVSDDAII